jgi:hypothetical protein
MSFMSKFHPALLRKGLTGAPRLAVLCFFALGLPVLHAQTTQSQPPKSVLPEPVQVTLERKKVSLADGKEVLTTASSAKPGEVIQETANYANRSKRTFRVDATLPVPAYTELVLGSTRPTNVTVSVDGTNFAPPPLKRRVPQPNGVVVEQTIPVSEYRFLRWAGVELGPEKSFSVSARFRLADGTSVNSAQPPAAAPSKVGKP